MILIISVVAVPAAARQNQTADIVIDNNDPRPLASAILELEARHGWIITYEDPPYEFAGDLVDVTASVRKDYDPTKSQQKILIPRGVPFKFTYTVPDQSQITDGRTPQVSDAMPTLVGLLDTYDGSGNGGKFRVLRTGTVLHVVPIMSSDARGIPTARNSRLDVRINLEAGERTVLETTRAILRAITALTGTNVTIGNIPFKLFSQTTVNEAASDEGARDVLMRTLAATKRNLSWQLFCQAGMNMCALNIHLVEPTADGKGK